MKHSSHCIVGAIVVALALAGCETAPREAPPIGLTWQAVTLRDVVERGCMAYALGEKPEAVAMKDAGLSRRRSFMPSWPSPGPNEPRYMNDAPGKPIISIYGPGCTVRVRGNDIAAFDRVLDRLYSQRFGPDYAARVPPPQPWDGQFPGMKGFCAAGHIFKSYPDPPDSIVQDGFTVTISPEPVSYCAAAS
jgi:hypothetical protein